MAALAAGIVRDLPILSWTAATVAIMNLESGLTDLRPVRVSLGVVRDGDRALLWSIEVLV